jgi:gliding motility-associated-like protein
MRRKATIFIPMKILSLMPLALFLLQGTGVWAQNQRWLQNTTGNGGMRSGNVSVSGQSLTVEAVVYFETAPSPTGAIISKHSGSNGTNANYLLRPEGFRFRTGTTERFLPNPCPLLPGRCYHIAAVYDGQAAYLYINGCLVNQIAATGNLFTNNANLGIGYRSNNSEHLRGFFDEVRIWNVARTREQIAADMYGPIAAPQTGLVAYYNFDGPNALSNLAGTQFNGTLQNPAVVANNTLCLNYIPFDAVASNNGPACIGGSVVLTADPVPDAGYQWTGPGGFVSNQRVAQRDNLSPADFGTYRLVVTSACCTDTAFTSFGLTPVVSAFASPQSVEIGDPVTLTASGANQYLWMPGNLIGASVTVFPTQTTTYTVTGTLDSAGCSNTAVVTVAVNCPSLVVLPAPSVSICQGQSVVLSVEEANGSDVYLSYSWSPTTGLSSGNQPAVIAAPSQTTVYTVTAFGLNGCVNTTTAVVQIGDGSFSFYADQTTICINQPVTLIAQGNNIEWLVNGVPIPPPPGNVLTEIPPPGTTFYTVRGADDSGCASEATIQVFVEIPPSITASVNDDQICLGESVTLTAVGNAQEYLWLPGEFSGTNVTVSPSQTTTFTLIGYTSSRCADTSLVTVYVGALGVDLDDVTLCQGNPVRLAVTDVPGATYQWSPPDGLSATDLPAVWANPSVTTVYTVVGTTTDGCTDQQTVTVTVVPSPTVNASSPSGAICPGNPALLLASNPGALPLTWFPGGANAAEIVVYPGVTTTYSAVVYAPNGCTDTATVTIVVYEPPVIEAFAAPSSVCPGVGAALSATGAVQYNVEPGNGFFLQGQNFNVFPTFTTTYTIIGANAFGCLDTAVVTVFIDSIAYLTPQTQDICRGDTATLSLQGYENYLWQPGSLTGAQVRVSPPLTTIYTVYASNPSGCADTVSFVVNVLPLPNPAILTQSDTVCFRYTTSLSAQGGVSYLWQPGSFTTATIFVALDTTTIFTLTATGENGCTQTTTREIAVVAPPVVTASAETDSVCPGATVRLFAAGARHYSWFNEQTGETFVGDTIQIVPDVVTTLILTGMDSYECTATDTLSVYQYPAPVFAIQASPNDSVCIGGSIILTVPPGFDYYWSSSLSFGDSTGTSVSVLPPAPGRYSIFAAAVDARGCSFVDTMTITVLDLPVLTARGDSVCPGATATLVASLVADGGSVAGEFTWFELDSLDQFTGNLYFDSPAEVVVQRKTRFAVVGTDVFGCLNTDTVEVFVRELPVAGVTQAGPYLCEGEAMALILSGGVNYEIQPDNFFLFTDFEQGIAFVRPNVTTTFTVTAFNEFGCADADTATVIVRANPAVTDFSYEPAICFGDSTSLFYSGTVDVIFWILEYGDTSLDLTGESVVLSPRTTTNYVLRAVNAFGCDAAVNVPLEVLPLPEVRTVPSDTAVCIDQVVQVRGTGAVAYLWRHLTDGDTLYGNLISWQVGTTAQTYELTGVDANGCVNRDTVTVVPLPRPNVTAAVDRDTVCEGELIFLSATGADSYLWFPIASTSPTPTANPQFTTDYRVYGFSAEGCVAIDEVRVTVVPYPNTQITADRLWVCRGGGLTLNGAGGQTFLWLPGGETTPSITVFPVQTTIYTLLSGQGPGCVAGRTVTVSVVENPDVQIRPPLDPDGQPDTLVCMFETATLTATGADVYYWEPGGLVGATVEVSLFMDTEFVVTGIGPSGCVGTDTIKLYFGPLPVVPFGASDDSICRGEDLVLFTDGYGGEMLYWTADADIVLNGATLSAGMPIGVPPVSSLTVTPVQTTRFLLTTTDERGCSSLESLDVYVQQRPVVAFSVNPPGLVCPQTPIRMVGFGARDFVWFPAPDSIRGDTAWISPKATTMYTVHFTGAMECVFTDSLLISVFAPSHSVSANPSEICEGEICTLSVVNAALTTWFPGQLTGNEITVSPAATTEYIAEIQDFNGCTRYDTVRVRVNPRPNVQAFAGKTVVCEGDTVVLRATGAQNYAWETGGAPVGNGDTVYVAVFANSVFSVTGIDSLGCLNTASITITVSSPPLTAASNRPRYCPFEPVILTGSGAVSYRWEPGGNTGSILNLIAPAATVTYTLFGTDTLGCESSRTVNVVVNPKPEISINAPFTDICPFQFVPLTVSGALNVTWAPATGLSNTFGAIVVASPAVTTTYTAIGANLQGCTDTATVTVNVLPPPNVTAVGPTHTLCPGATAQLSATGAANYTWFPGGLTGANVATQVFNTTTYTAVGVSQNGCPDTAFVTVNVYPEPTLSLTPSETTICVGSQTTLTAQGSTFGFYGWAPQTGLVQINGNVVVAAPTQTTTYTVTFTDNNGCAFTRQATVNVAPLPQPVVTPAETTICAGQTITLVGTGAQQYNWQFFDANNQLQEFGGQTLTVQPQTTTFYTLTGRDGFNCSNTTVGTISVLPLPALSITADKTVLCPGESANVTAAGANVYIWSDGVNQYLGPTQTFSPSATTTYTLTGQGSNGCAAETTLTIVRNPQPPVTANFDSDQDRYVCAGTTISLTATGADTYIWLPGEFIGAQYTPTPEFSTTYTVTGVDVSTGCSASATLDVTVARVPLTVSGPDAPICPGTRTVLVAQGANSYVWNNEVGGPTYEVAPLQTTTYTVSGIRQFTFSDGINTYTRTCTETTSITVEVRPLPVFVADASRNNICPYSPVKLRARLTQEHSTPVSFRWLPINQTADSLVVTPDRTTEYTVIATDGYACAETLTVNVNVLLAPTVTVNATAEEICPGAAVTLRANGADLYRWSPSAGIPDPNAAEINVRPERTTVYTLVGTALNGCTDTVEVRVGVFQPFGRIVSREYEYCSGDAIVLYAMGFDYGEAIFNPAPIDLIDADTAWIGIFLPETTTTYRATGFSPEGCPMAAEVTITMNPYPGGQIEASPPPYCYGSPVTLTAPAGPFTYLWNTGETTRSIVVFDEKGYRVQITDTSKTTKCTTTSEFLRFDFRERPVAAFVSDLPTVRTGVPIQFFDRSTSRDGRIVSWEWRFGDGTVLRDTNPIHRFGAQGNQSVVLIVTTDGGCTDTASADVVISNEEKVVVPTAFSPNSDGVNEIYYVMPFNVENFKFQIFNRWGTMIFETDNPRFAWDGSIGTGAGKGEQVPEGAYLYKLEAKGSLTGIPIYETGMIFVVR